MDKKRLQELAGINAELLNETYSNNKDTNFLYHYTDLIGLKGILKDGFILKPSLSDDKSGGYVSFTRDKDSQYIVSSGIKIILNRDILKYKYKIELYNDLEWFSLPLLGKLELEERIKGPVNIKNSIVQINITLQKIFNGVFGKEKNELISCLKILKQNNIPFHIYNKEYIKNLINWENIEYNPS